MLLWLPGTHTSCRNDAIQRLSSKRGVLHSQDNIQSYTELGDSSIGIKGS